MRILLSAYACCPGMGSEPGLGWNWARGLAARHRVHVVTATWSRARIRAWLERNPGPVADNLSFTWVPDLFAATSLWPLGLGWLHYYLWQWRAYLATRPRHAAERFEIAHCVSYNTWRAPCFLWRLGVPLVLGPVGGGQSSPRCLRGLLGARGRAKESVREICQRLSTRDPLVRATLANAQTVLAANAATAALLARLGAPRLERMLETAVEVPPAPPPPPAPGGNACRLLWAGHMEPRKALGLLLRALELLPAGRFHLEVAGHGPEQERWQAEARARGLAGNVRFLGSLERADLLRRHGETDIFVFTSMRETSGNVVLEAMAAARPVVCLDVPGPADIVDRECACLIAPASPETTARELAAVLQLLAADPRRRRRLGLAGYERARRCFTWPAKLEAIEAVYARALGAART